MNPVTDIVFSLTWILLLIWAVRSVISGWRSKPVRDFNAGRLSGTWTTEVKKPVHPEMVDVKPGEELMGVTFKQREEDPLQQSLKSRIEELSTDEDEDDDDDGGDVIVRV